MVYKQTATLGEWGLSSPIEWRPEVALEVFGFFGKIVGRSTYWLITCNLFI